MNVLFVGGTGAISTASSHETVSRGNNLWLLNRGTRNHRAPAQAHLIKADMEQMTDSDTSAIRSRSWDVVVNWQVFTPAQAIRDIEMFNGTVGHYIFISSTAAYRRPQRGQLITESDETGNDYWSYGRDKAACEEIFLKAHRGDGFPVTIVRPGHTYADFALPTNIIGLGFGLIERIINREKVIFHDGGKTLWTLTHSEDFARGLSGLYGNTETQGQSYHITSSESASWNEILMCYQNILNIEINRVDIPSTFIGEHSPRLGPTLLGDKARDMTFDNGNIMSVVPDYKARTGYMDGINRTVEWHFDNPDLIYFNPTIGDEIERLINLYSHAPDQRL
jgi:nucleoside-diphosphate-sugar epimerase